MYARIVLVTGAIVAAFMSAIPTRAQQVASDAPDFQ